MPTSDKNFLWWFGAGRDPEHYHGGVESRDEAVQYGWTEYPEGDFTIMEADKAVPTFDYFNANDILERYEEHNEECWGEDGSEIESTGVQRKELEAVLTEAFGTWLERHNLVGRVWAFGTSRNEEYFPAKQLEAQQSPQASDGSDANV